MEADVIRAMMVDEELLEERAAGSTDLSAQPSTSGTFAPGGARAPPPQWATASGLTAAHMETLKLLLSGGVAGAFSKSCTAPLARLTILYQINGLQAAVSSSGGGGAATVAAAAPRLGVWAAMQQVVRTEGLRALWKGNGVTIIHRLPYSAANFWTYEQVRHRGGRRLPPPQARVLASYERVAERLLAVPWVAAAGSSRSAWQAAWCGSRGPEARAKALWPTLAQLPPLKPLLPAAQVNEIWKRYLPPTPASAGGDAVDIARRLVSGGVAGMSACALAYPLDLVRTRLAAQTQQR